MPIVKPNSPDLIAISSRWVAMFKPAGWLTIPGRPGQHDVDGGAGSPVLLDWIKVRYGQVWTVHRLDKDTSGVVLFARTVEDHKIANTWFQKHQVKKLYDCIAQGVPKAPVLKLNNPIAGAVSVTQVEVKESYREGFLARVRPLSGRRHQIRIHLSQSGHPIWGDVLYGGPANVKLGNNLMPVKRVALHAAYLELPTKEVFLAPWSDDFKEWIDRLRTEGTHG